MARTAAEQTIVLKYQGRRGCDIKKLSALFDWKIRVRLSHLYQLHCVLDAADTPIRFWFSPSDPWPLCPSEQVQHVFNLMQQNTFDLALLPGSIGAFAMNGVGLSDSPKGLSGMWPTTMEATFLRPTALQGRLFALLFGPF